MVPGFFRPMILNPWFYRGDMRTLPKPSEWAGKASSLYLLQFRDRCKVGISTNPPARLKALHCTHRQTAGAGVMMAAISTPTEHAKAIEQSLLKEFSVLRIAGEYLAIDFDTLATAAADELKRGKRPPVERPSNPPPFTPQGVKPVRAMHLMPRVIRLKTGPHAFAVEWYLHDTALWVTEWQTLRRTFETLSDAQDFSSKMRRYWLATHYATGITRKELFGFDS